MRILANVIQLQDKATFAAALSSQLSRNVKEMNDIYYNLDSEVKSRQGIGSSIHSLQQRIEKVQQKMYNISSFLGETARQYNIAESSIVARAASLETVSNITTADFAGFGGSTSGFGVPKSSSEICVGAVQGAAISAVNDSKNKNKVDSVLDVIQTAIDVFGFIPAIGDAMDGINVLISLCRGNILDAALSAIGLVPVLGSAVAVALKKLFQAGGNVNNIKSIIMVLASIFGGIDKIIDGLKLIMKAVADIVKNIPSQLDSLLNNGAFKKLLGDGVKVFREMIESFKGQLDKIFSKLDEIVEKVKKAIKSEGIPNINLNQKPNVSNEKLKNIINDLYKGQGGLNTIGNGTTMDAVRNEIKTGLPTNGKFHTQKLKDYLNALQRRLRAGDLNDYDKSVVNALIEDINNALKGQ